MDSQEFSLGEVDRDGAIRETAQEAAEILESEGDTRATFFKKAGLAGGTLMGGGALLGTLMTGTAVAGNRNRPPAEFGAGDIGILNFALTLEFLERDFYKEATENNKKKKFLNKGSETNFLKAVLPDEHDHVAFLRSALGKSQIKKPKFGFGKAVKDRETFLETAFQLEDTGVGAYLGQALNISNVAYTKAALSIATIEARHSGLIGEITRGANGVAPHTAFDRTLGADMVLKRVKKTGFIKG